VTARCATNSVIKHKNKEGKSDTVNETIATVEERIKSITMNYVPSFSERNILNHLKLWYFNAHVELDTLVLNIKQFFQKQYFHSSKYPRLAAFSFLKKKKKKKNKKKEHWPKLHGISYQMEK
jgi:hypothetical protein